MSPTSLKSPPLTPSSPLSSSSWDSLATISFNSSLPALPMMPGMWKTRMTFPLPSSASSPKQTGALDLALLLLLVRPHVVVSHYSQHLSLFLFPLCVSHFLFPLYFFLLFSSGDCPRELGGRGRSTGEKAVEMGEEEGGGDGGGRRRWRWGRGRPWGEERLKEKKRKEKEKRWRRANNHT